MRSGLSLTSPITQRGGTVVISAHLDDAVLSASHLLLSRPCTVLTIFAGPPGTPDVLTAWDVLTGATTSAQRHRERLAEDDRALAVVGARAHRLAEPEEQYRDGSPAVQRCVEAVARELSGVAEVWMPLGVGRHPEHLLAREIAAAAAVAVGVPRAGFYADFPYVARYGWPSWVTGCAPEPYLNPDGWLALQLSALGLGAVDARPRVVRLSSAERQCKVRAMAEYHSQLPALRLDPRGLDAIACALDYELRWTVPASQLSRVAPTGLTP